MFRKIWLHLFHFFAVNGQFVTLGFVGLSKKVEFLFLQSFIFGTTLDQTYLQLSRGDIYVANGASLGSFFVFKI